MAMVTFIDATLEITILEKYSMQCISAVCSKQYGSIPFQTCHDLKYHFCQLKTFFYVENQ